MSAPAKPVNDREATAERLLRSSLDHSYEPSIDIDWSAPLVDGLWGVPEHRVSLYGTELWDTLSDEQKRTLSIHELCSVARIGLWFEMILMQMLLRYSYDRDPRSRHIQYALTEIADECRHSIMFAKMNEHCGVPDYRPRRLTHELGRVFKAVASGPAMFAGTLFVEEILDQLQREAMRDETVQPLTRMVNKIHVTEEARHVRTRARSWSGSCRRSAKHSAPPHGGSPPASRTSSGATSCTSTSMPASASHLGSGTRRRWPTPAGRSRCAGRPARWCRSCASRA